MNPVETVGLLHPGRMGSAVGPQIVNNGHTVLWCPAGRLADDHGITETLLIEAERMPRDILANRDYLPSVAARAWRWAPEMHEVANTLDAQHLLTDLALATAAVLQHWADNANQSTDLSSVLHQLHRPSR